MADAIDLSAFSESDDPSFGNDQSEGMTEEQAKMATAGVRWNPIHPPCTIQLVDGSIFHTFDAESVHYTNIGLYATGRWGVTLDIKGEDVYTDEEDTTRSILIMWKQVKLVEFNYDLQQDILDATGGSIIPAGDDEVVIEES